MTSRDFNSPFPRHAIDEDHKRSRSLTFSDWMRRFPLKLNKFWCGELEDWGRKDDPFHEVLTERRPPAASCCHCRMTTKPHTHTHVNMLFLTWTELYISSEYFLCFLSGVHMTGVVLKRRKPGAGCLYGATGVGGVNGVHGPESRSRILLGVSITWNLKPTADEKNSLGKLFVCFKTCTAFCWHTCVCYG